VGYGVAGGVTERELSDADAAKTYGEPATLDAGVIPDKVARPEKSAEQRTLDADTDPSLKPVRAEQNDERER
jgi:hypothetical protein